MATKILQLKVTLRHIDPPIWRRIEVKDDITFYELHHIIQIVMGWWNAHLFEFRIDGNKIGIPDDEWDDPGLLDSQEIVLSRFIKAEKMNFSYLYDFGDSWMHEIEVEKISDPVQRYEYPACTGGERNCPPEDVGGPPGYYNFVEAMKDKRHPQHRELKEWYGELYDPEYFDLNETNGELQFIIKTKHWSPN